ncbi:unnamed protein product [Phyllotreta striolata]|uniref:Protein hook n=1 Tax=Phyllotreta striolata TaxID=444603 RepID=A0A9N9XJW5_PHYSR|nr:unnamed protein product [Phyllotreta striolata]
MDPSEDMCKSLAKWLQKIVPNKTRTIQEICDGVGMLDALLQISPEHFSKLETKIKRDVGANNWRLRISNLKKILEAVIEYYQDVLTLNVLESGVPDVVKMGESNDLVQLAKLLRLILGCAINCEKKQEYITMIMDMEESIQQNIKQAIEQLEEVTGGSGRSISLLILDSDTRVMKLVSDLESSNKSREALTHQVQSLEQQIQSLLDDKKILQDQHQALLEREAKNPQENIRKQLEALKEELFKSEVMRDDFKAKLFEQEKQILTYQEKITELQLAANESAKLKDEIDALTESASKVVNLESALTSYKKRLENYQDIKRNLQKLEEKNMEYIQKNMELEEEISKNSTWKSQCEAYKNEILELQQKLDEETQKYDKAAFNYEKIKEKFETLQGEKERLMLERDALREENEELKLSPKGENGAAVSQELTPAEMERKLKLLEKENKTLKSSSQELDSKQVHLESALSRIDKLQQKNKSLNQTILKLEAQLEELKAQQSETQSTSNSSSIGKEYRQKIVQLQESLSSKENELQILQTKYNRNLEKAREVAQNLDLKSNGDVDSSLRQSNQEENRLLTTAFNRLTLNCHKETIDERLSALNGAQGQSFLSRQRQSTPRKPMQRFKSK